MNYSNQRTNERTTTSLLVFILILTSIFFASDISNAQAPFSPGQEGQEVKELQSKLEELSFFSVTRTGLYGEETRRAVERFQAAADLKPDGIAGSTTLKSLSRALNNIDVSQRKNLKIYTHDVDVIYLQNLLNQLGYFSSNPTGLFREVTRSAVIEFQKDNGLEADGIVGRSTWEALEKQQRQLTAETEEANEEKEIAEEKTEPEQAETETSSSDTDTEEVAESKPDKKNLDLPIIRQGDKGEAVTTLQKELKSQGLYPLPVDGTFGYQTGIAVRQFQQLAGLKADGVVGSSTWNKLLADTTGGESSTYRVKSGDSLWVIANRFDTSVGEIQAANNLSGNSIRAGQSLRIPGGSINTRTIDAMDWGQVTRLFPRNSVATITDVNTGLSFRIRRLYGTNHADVEPLSSRDTNILRRIYGGAWSWDRRAVIVNINGRLLAGSINGVPHGGQSISNNFNGHICLHFKNSRTHGSNSMDRDHQNMIRKAAEQNWPLYRN
ncbi:MAG: peptidoglycan-binding protein [Bacillota bacterium]